MYEGFGAFEGLSILTKMPSIAKFLSCLFVAGLLLGSRSLPASPLGIQTRWEGPRATAPDPTDYQLYTLVLENLGADLDIPKVRAWIDERQGWKLLPLAEVRSPRFQGHLRFLSQGDGSKLATPVSYREDSAGADGIPLARGESLEVAVWVRGPSGAPPLEMSFRGLRPGEPPFALSSPAPSQAISSTRGPISARMHRAQLLSLQPLAGDLHRVLLRQEVRPDQESFEVGQDLGEGMSLQTQAWLGDAWTFQEPQPPPGVVEGPVKVALPFAKVEPLGPGRPIEVFTLLTFQEGSKGELQTWLDTSGHRRDVSRLSLEVGGALAKSPAPKKAFPSSAPKAAKPRPKAPEVVVAQSAKPSKITAEWSLSTQPKRTFPVGTSIPLEIKAQVGPGGGALAPTLHLELDPSLSFEIDPAQLPPGAIRSKETFLFPPASPGDEIHLEVTLKANSKRPQASIQLQVGDQGEAHATLEDRFTILPLAQGFSQLKGRVYLDLDRDQAPSKTEVGAAGWSVEFRDSEGQLGAQAKTLDQGRFQFANLPAPALYSIRVVDPQGRTRAEVPTALLAEAGARFEGVDLAVLPLEESAPVLPSSQPAVPSEIEASPGDLRAQMDVPFSDPLPSEDSAPRPKLIVRKLLRTAQLEPGDTGVLRLDVFNLSSRAQANWEIRDQLPPGLRYRSTDCQSEARCDLEVLDPHQARLTSSELEPGERRVFYLLVTAEAGYPPAPVPGRPAILQEESSQAFARGEALSPPAKLELMLPSMPPFDEVALLGRVVWAPQGQAPGAPLEAEAGIVVVTPEGHRLRTRKGGFLHLSGFRLKPGRYQIDPGSLPAHWSPGLSDLERKLPARPGRPLEFQWVLGAEPALMDRRAHAPALQAESILEKVATEVLPPALRKLAPKTAPPTRWVPWMDGRQLAHALGPERARSTLEIVASPQELSPKKPQIQLQLLGAAQPSGSWNWDGVELKSDAPLRIGAHRLVFERRVEGKFTRCLVAQPSQQPVPLGALVFGGLEKSLLQQGEAIRLRVEFQDRSRGAWKKSPWLTIPLRAKARSLEVSPQEAKLFREGMRWEIPRGPEEHVHQVVEPKSGDRAMVFLPFEDAAQPPSESPYGGLCADGSCQGLMAAPGL